MSLDLSDAAKRLDGVLHAAGAKTIPVPGGLGYFEARLGARAVATTALSGERIARAVLSQVRALPFYGSLGLVVHPVADIDAPVLVADVQVPAFGRAHAYVDVCGPAIARPSFRKEFFEPLERALGSTFALRTEPVPGWIAPLSGGCGALVRSRGKTATQLFGLVLGYVETYLSCLGTASPSSDPAANIASARSVADLARSHGRGGRMLARAFGDARTASYMRFVWND